MDKYGFKHTQIILDGDTYISANDKETLEAINPILSRILPHPKLLRILLIIRLKGRINVFVPNLLILQI